MAYFHLKLLSPRSTFPHDATPAELAAMREHAAYWQANAEAGTALVVGPVFAESGAWGMAVVEAENASGAQAMADADPVIAADLGFRFEIAPIPSLILRRDLAGVAV